MTFPNAYQGIKKLLFAEILGILTFAVSLLYALIASGIKSLQGLLSFTSILLPVILGLSIITVVIRFFALGRAAQDEGTFGTAQIANLIYLVLTVLNQFVKNSLLGFAASIASICVTMLILTGIMRLALRLRNADVYDRGQLLKRLIWFLIFSPVLLAFAVALLMKSSAGAILFLVSGCAARRSSHVFLLSEPGKKYASRRKNRRMGPAGGRFGGIPSGSSRSQSLVSGKARNRMEYVPARSESYRVGTSFSLHSSPYCV